MDARSRLVFGILGPLEARVGGRALPLGGTKQRTVLAVLLLAADEMVPSERIAEAVWDAEPPPSSAHTIEGYVSRLRRTIEPYGPRLPRVGNGYRLELGGAVLDSRVFEELLDAGSRAAEAGDQDEARGRTVAALALWRGPALGGTSLHVETERLGELRLQALEQRIRADLALGRHGDVVVELRRLVDEHPYHERFVERLMVALYRSGRQAEALEVYERTRKMLRETLGLQPTAELQRLSAEIVRHEPRLGTAAPSIGSRPRPDRRRRLRAWVMVPAAVTVLAVAALGFVLHDHAHSRVRPTGAERVALVVPRPPSADRADTFVQPLVDGLALAAREYGLETSTLVLDELDPKPRLAAVVASLRSGRFDLVVVAGSALAGALAPAARRLRSVRWVLLDGYAVAPNETGFVPVDEQAGYLAGYLAGLVEAGSGRHLNAARVVSVVGGIRRVPAVRKLVRGFVRGARRAFPRVTVLAAYSEDFVDESKCEEIADRQIDAGSDIVFAASGTCGLGALRAAGIRGVWGIGADGDRSYLGDHILVSTEKRMRQVVLLAVRSFVNGTLPGGRTVALGLKTDAVGIVGISPEVPSQVRRAVAHADAVLSAGLEP